MASCQLYQLFSKRELNPGDYVEVNGPWDRFGYIIKSTEQDGKFLNLIRGCHARDGERPVARF